MQGQGGQDDGKPAHVPGQNIPLSCPWPWCGGCVPPTGLWGPPAPQAGGDKLLCALGRGHIEGDMQAQRSCFWGGVFHGGHCHGAGAAWGSAMGGLPAGEGCVGCVHGGAGPWGAHGGIRAVQWAGQCMGDHGGANWGHQPCPLSPWLGPAGRKQASGQDGDERCHGPSCGHGCKSCTNTASPTWTEGRQCPRERGMVTLSRDFGTSP